MKEGVSEDDEKDKAPKEQEDLNQENHMNMHQNDINKEAGRNEENKKQEMQMMIQVDEMVKREGNLLKETIILLKESLAEAQELVKDVRNQVNEDTV